MEANDLSSLVSAVTSNPEMMRRVMGALSSLSVGGEAQSEGPEPKQPPQESEYAEEKEGSLPVGLSHDKQEEHRNIERKGSDRKRLLIALKPYLGKERRSKAEMLINIMSLLDSGLLDMLGKGE